MATLKIYWKEKQDARRISIRAMNETLFSLDNRVIPNYDTFTLQNLKDYILYIFSDQKSIPHQIQLFYTDEDQEKVCIGNEAELQEMLLVMKELAAANGENAAKTVIRIHVETCMEHSVTQTINRGQSSVEIKIMDTLVDMKQLLEAWKPGLDFHSLKLDLVSLLHEEGLQRALLHILSDKKLSELLNDMMQRVKDGKNVSACAMSENNAKRLDEMSNAIIAHCPQSIARVTRIAQFLKIGLSAAYLSNSGYFECVFKDETAENAQSLFAEFEQDITCPDGTVLPPKHHFDKIWRIRNSGPTRWPDGTRLSCVGGDIMQALDSVLVPAVAAGNVIDVCIRMVSPERVGRYTGYWRLSTVNNVRFGHRFWVDINVSQNTRPDTEDTDTISMDPPMRHMEIKVEKDASKWNLQVRTLEELGFTDRARNQALLLELDGDLSAVISMLV